MKKLFNLLSFILLLGEVAFSQCIDTVYMDYTVVDSGNNVNVSFEVENFYNMGSMQFTVKYDASLISYESLGSTSLPGFNESTVYESTPGRIGVAWVDPAVQGVDVADNTTIFTFQFERVSAGGIEIEITDNPVDVEFGSSTGELYCLNFNDGGISTNDNCDPICYGNVTSFLQSGSVLVSPYDFFNSTQNCDVASAIVNIENSNGDVFSGNTITLVEEGEYSYQVELEGTLCTGTLTVNGPISSDCVDSIFFTLNTFEDGDDVILELNANGFSEVQGAQFSLNYNGSVLKFEDVESALPQFSAANTNATVSGQIGLIWIDNTGVTPFSIANGETAFRFRFSKKQSGFSNFTITDTPTTIEFSNPNGEVICFDYSSANINVTTNSNPGTGGCIDTVYLSVVPHFDGEEVRVDVVTYDFENIVSLQFALEYDNTVLQYDRFGGSDLDQFNESNVYNTGDFITATWIDGSLQGADMPDGSVVYSVYFKALQNANTNLAISDDGFRPDYTEVSTADSELLCVNSEQGEVVIDGAHYYGYIVVDRDLDCEKDVDEQGLRDWFITLTDGNNTYNFDTDENGYFSLIVPPSSYTITAHAPNALWSFCDNDVQADTPSNNDFFFIDFLAQASEDCAHMTIDLSAPFLRRCFESNYYLSYCNQGTITAEDSYIEVILDDDLAYVSSNHPDVVVNGQVVTFTIGDVPLGDCGDIKFRVEVSCDAELGQTHCSEATIFPFDDCVTNQSDLMKVSGTCEGDSVRFRIENTSLQDVQTAFIVIEDDVMMIENPLNLQPQDSYEIGLESNGSTYRLTAYQDISNPINTMITKAIEGCGVNDQGTFSTGFVTMFEESDGSGNVDIDCQENIGSYDPNDKMGSPKGYRAQHYINAETALEYRLRFQNTGTDTAFRVVVKDELTEDLDLLSIQLGSASHPYTFSLEDSRTLVFTFDNINLVHKGENEELSNGFVEFKINQKPGNEDGTLILNDANIYFDFNDPIVTNETNHLVGSDYIESSISSINIIDQTVRLNVYPNPFVDHFNIELQNIELENASIEVYDLTGRKIHKQKIARNLQQIDFKATVAGEYIFKLLNDGSLVATGKIISQ